MADQALLLGINDYQKVNPLRGCVNDVRNMQKLLTETFRFDPRNIRVLLNEQVVKKSVNQEMDRLFKDARSGDRVVLHFSGHGSYTEDLDGDEPDGQDELICLYDMDFADPETYLLDDELRHWTEKLPRSVQLTIVFDSCHSGTATRLVMAPAPDNPHRQIPMRVDDRATLARARKWPAASRRRRRSRRRWTRPRTPTSSASGSWTRRRRSRRPWRNGRGRPTAGWSSSRN